MGRSELFLHLYDANIDRNTQERIENSNCPAGLLFKLRLLVEREESTGFFAKDKYSEELIHPKEIRRIAARLKKVDEKSFEETGEWDWAMNLGDFLTHCRKGVEGNTIDV